MSISNINAATEINSITSQPTRRNALSVNFFANTLDFSMLILQYSCL